MRQIKTEMRPRLSGIRRLVDAVAITVGIAKRRFARADIHHVGIGLRHGDRADGGDGLSVEHRHPRAAGIDGFPDAAVHVAEVELVRTSGHAAHRVDASATEGADHAPMEAAVERRIES
jgi:hypothetical protein